MPMETDDRYNSSAIAPRTRHAYGRRPMGAEASSVCHSAIDPTDVETSPREDRG
jgi:hypothetical protein